jgi:CubicO group peptidase (beta-lactamase class C family)
MRFSLLRYLPLFVLAAPLCYSAQSSAQSSTQMTPALRSSIDAAAQKVLAETGVPSAAVGVVMDGRIVLTTAYGDARLAPALKASATMAYPIGSISKQFTATAILLLVQEGKLSLDDTVSRFFPELTRSNEVTIRELLSHTSGYEDYAPQDYTIPLWTKAGDPLDLVHLWAEKPLDFDPGTQWQYSNTNFVLAALIVQKVSGMPFAEFLKTRVLAPAGLKDVLNLNTDQSRLEVTGYMRNALGPLRPAVLEAPGWYFGDGDLAMPVASLLTWDIGIINKSLLQPTSYEAFETDVKLKDGKPTGYGLGVDVGVRNGHRYIEHSGEVGGFVAENLIFLDDKLAISVLTNQEASSAASGIARAILPLLLPSLTATTSDPGKVAAETQAKAILEGLIAKKIDRSLFTANCTFYFSDETIGDFSSSLAPLGPIASLTQNSSQLRGGMTFRAFAVKFGAGEKSKTVTLTTYTMPDGKLEQFLIEP